MARVVWLNKGLNKFLSEIVVYERLSFDVQHCAKVIAGWYKSSFVASICDKSGFDYKGCDGA